MNRRARCAASLATLAVAVVTASCGTDDKPSNVDAGPDSSSSANSYAGDAGDAGQSTTVRPSISVGRARSCVVTLEGEVWCWGKGVVPTGAERGPNDRPAWLEKLESVNTAVDVWTDYGQTCVVDAAGGLWCRAFGSEGDPDLVRIEAVSNALSARGNCVLLVGGDVLCQPNFWVDGLGEVVDLEPLRLEANAIGIARNLREFCLLDAEGSVQCWDGSYPTGSARTIETPVSFVEIDGAYMSFCGRTDGGEVWCWGDINGSSEPQQVADVAGAVEVAVGGPSACAIDLEGATRCWGDGAAVPLDIPPAEVIDLSVDHGCAVLRDDRIACWGANDSGQAGAQAPLADGSVSDVDLEDVVDISASGAQACAIRQDESVWCWGQRSRFDDGEWDGRPVQLDWLPPVAALRFGVGLGCALGVDGALWCWGYVDGTTVSVPFRDPHHLEDLGRVVSFDVGEFEFCAVLEDGAVECRSHSGGMCPNDGLFRFDAVPDEIDVGANYGCARVGADVYCWGAPGVPRPDPCPTPEPYVNLQGSVDISAGYGTVCGLLEDGSLRCIGDLGGVDDPGPFRALETSVEWRDPVYGSRWQGESVCTITEATGVQCWGGMDWTPADLSGVTRVAIGQGFACALLDVGRVSCWGNNGRGQLGDGGIRIVTEPHIFEL